MQTNTGKTIIFSEIICICKHFTVKNILRRNKRSLRRKKYMICKKFVFKTCLYQKSRFLTELTNGPFIFVKFEIFYFGVLKFDIVFKKHFLSLSFFFFYLIFYIGSSSLISILKCFFWFWYKIKTYVDQNDDFENVIKFDRLKWKISNLRDHFEKGIKFGEPK